MRSSTGCSRPAFDRSSSSRSCRATSRATRPRRSSRSRASSPRRATSNDGPRSSRDLVAHLRGPVRTRRGGAPLGVRGLERAEPAPVLVGHRIGLPPPVRGRPSGPSSRSIRSSASVGRRPPRSAGSTTCSSTAETNDVPIDFLSIHTYGMPPLDLRPVTARYGTPGPPALVDRMGREREARRAPINDSAWAAPLVARGMHSAAGRVEALAYWVASDHFVELGESATLFHGGFGLLTIGNLRKPRFWADRDARATGPRRAGESSSTATAPDLSSRRGHHAIADGRVAIASLERDARPGHRGGRRIARPVGIPRGRRPAAGAATSSATIGWTKTHSNIVGDMGALGRPDWPDDAGWARLREADGLELLEPPRGVGRTAIASTWSSTCRCPRCR